MDVTQFIQFQIIFKQPPFASVCSEMSDLTMERFLSPYHILLRYLGALGRRKLSRLA